MFETEKMRWLNVAESLKPELHTERACPIDGMPKAPLAEGDTVILDFGNHYVGYLTLKFGYEGSHPDAPAWISFKFCENQREIDETLEGYQGWISKGWIQQEQVHVDVLPQEIRLPRRYAFRYVRMDVLAVSSKYRLVIENVCAVTTTSADDSNVHPYIGDEQDTALDRVSLRTLRSCMQDFFEDGPKRDRRLWLGDLRLQALTNSVTYRNFSLVKRCLYLFAACADQDGRLPACLFTEPRVEGDDTYMYDYSLFFIPTLLQYIQATGDQETAADLLPLALHQLALADQQFDPNTQLIRDSNQLGWCFVDWNLYLNKQCCAQAIWIYCAKAALKMKPDDALQRLVSRRIASVKAYFYDSDRHLFMSGAQRQVSWASQIWGVLAGIVEGDEARLCLQTVSSIPDAIPMVTPYMMHHYVEALCVAGQKKKAHQVIREYWGGMITCGADTYWELYNPQNHDESPYGSAVVNSYCHAWSCTPAWFLRSRILED